MEKSNICDICQKICKNYRGMKIHRFHCQKKQTLIEEMKQFREEIKQKTEERLIKEQKDMKDCCICMESKDKYEFTKICENKHKVCDICLIKLEAQTIITNKSQCPLCRSDNYHIIKGNSDFNMNQYAGWIIFNYLLNTQKKPQFKLTNTEKTWINTHILKLSIFFESDKVKSVPVYREILQQTSQNKPNALVSGIKIILNIDHFNMDTFYNLLSLKIDSIIQE